jgi:hypothetical protein
MLECKPIGLLLTGYFAILVLKCHLSGASQSMHRSAKNKIVDEMAGATKTFQHPCKTLPKRHVHLQSGKRRRISWATPAWGKAIPSLDHGGRDTRATAVSQILRELWTGIELFRVFGAITDRTMDVSLVPFETNRIRKCLGDISTRES